MGCQPKGMDVHPQLFQYHISQRKKINKDMEGHYGEVESGMDGKCRIGSQGQEHQKRTEPADHLVR